MACPIEQADITNDGWVNIFDLVLVAWYWLASVFPPEVDTNSDGAVNLWDLALVAGWFLHHVSECV